LSNGQVVAAIGVSNPVDGALVNVRVGLMCLVLIVFVCSLSVSFAAVTIMTYFTPVMSYLPSLLMSVIIAMSFDYSLFLLLRYREELLLHPSQTPLECVQVSVFVTNFVQHASFTL
jgi:predicted RND superfamily exporter protein